MPSGTRRPDASSTEGPPAAEQRRARAVESGLDVRSRPGFAFPVFEVRNPARATQYTVVAPMFPGREHAMCTCTDFSRRALGTCKHIESVWLWTEEHPGEPTIELPEPTGNRWAEIDRAIAATLSDRSGPVAIRYRGPGKWLTSPRH